MAIISSVNKKIGSFMGYTAATKFISKELEKGYKEPAKYAAKMMVVSIVSKDIINCAFYTYQSLNNEKIPKEKRSFVAANDLVLGFINVGGQILSYMLFDKFIIPKISGRLYTSTVKDSEGKEHYKYSQAPMSADNLLKSTGEVMKEEQAKLKATGLNLDKAMKNIETISDGVVEKLGHSSSKGKDLATGVSIIVGALATMALIKRTISPIFATPIAGKLSNDWNKRAAAKNKDDKQPTLDITEAQTYYQNNKMNNDNVKSVWKDFNSNQD